jgi:hypothetical protein
MQEARREGRKLPALPSILPHNRVIHDGLGTRSMFEKWNQSIVNSALIPIMDQFHPAI